MEQAINFISFGICLMIFVFVMYVVFMNIDGFFDKLEKKGQKRHEERQIKKQQRKKQ